MFKQGDILMDDRGAVCQVTAVKDLGVLFQWRLIEGVEIHYPSDVFLSVWHNDLFTKIDPAVFDILKGLK